MAQVTPYNPGPVPNLGVGTPGYNPAPGESFRALARGIGATRAQLANAISARNNAILGPLGQQSYQFGRSLGNAYADAVQKNQKATTALKQNLANQAVNDSLYTFRDAADKAQAAYQQQNQDRPGDGVSAFNDWLDNSADAVRDNFKNSPHGSDLAAFNRLSDALNDTKLSQNRKMNSWSLSVQTDQAHAQIDNAVAQTVQDISGAQGDIVERLRNYYNVTANAHNMLLNSEPSIGAHNVAKMRIQLSKQAPVAFFQNLASTVPDDPQEALSYVHAARSLLDNSEKSQLLLEAGDKLHLQELYDSTEAKVVKDMEGQLSVDDLNSDRQAALFKLKVDENWNDPALQQQALNHAAQQSQALNLKALQIEKNPSMPEPVKQSYLKSIGVQIGHLDTLTNAAKANLHHIDTLNRQDLQAALSEKRREDFEAKQAAKQQLKENSNQAQLKLNDMRNQLAVLGQKPVDNMAQIQAQSKEMYDYAKQMGRAGYLTPAEAEMYQQNAMKATSGAAQYQRATPNIFGIPLPTLGGPPPVKKQKFDKTQQDRSTALSAVVGAIGDIHSMGHQAQINELSGLKPGQQEFFNQNYASWLQQRNAMGKPPTANEKNQFTFKLRALAATQKDQGE